MRRRNYEMVLRDLAPMGVGGRAKLVGLGLFLTRCGAANMVPPAMSSGASPAFALIRLPRGGPPPSQEDLLNALRGDRQKLHLPPNDDEPSLEVAGPYAITVDGESFDEYVCWER